MPRRRRKLGAWSQELTRERVAVLQLERLEMLFPRSRRRKRGRLRRLLARLRPRF